MEIRRLQSGDHHLLAQTIQALVPEEDRRNNTNREALLKQALENVSCYYIVCLLDGRPIGYLSAYLFPNVENADYHVQLFDIIVEEAYRGTGIGTRMLELLKHHCRADQVSLIWCGTGLDNEAAQHFYERNGAQKVEACAEYIL